MQLIIAEKPSVAMSIANALDATNKKDGYIGGNNLLVSWCVGHLVSFAEASDYNEQYKKWRYEDLPILPHTWQYILSPGKESQFAILKNLMERSDVTELVNACDAGREGELIFRLVVNMAGCHKPISRLWISSMEDSAIREGFAELKPGADFEPLFASALCRSKADWLIGINATRLFSVLYHKTLNVGRVQTPTLAMLCERENKIIGFQKEKYHHVRIAFDETEVISEKIPTLEEAQTMQTACHNRQAVCVSLDKEKKTIKPPKLFDLTTLQREANRLFGYTAKQTLDYAQSLYERKLLTYPRTDSKYLTADMMETASCVVHMAASVPPFESCSNFFPDISLVVSDKDVSDHHAIIPTMELEKRDLAALPVGERNVLLLVCCKLLCAVAEPHTFEAVTAVFTCGEYRFTVKGKNLICEGWRGIERLFCASLKNKAEDDTETESSMLSVVEGQTFETVTASITEHFTTPPKPYTEDTLLSAMESAGKEDMPEDAERKGLGTPATRASIIEKLVSSGFAERKGKSLIPTKDGGTLIELLPEVLTSPLLTAEWENALTQIAKGAANPDSFMRDIERIAKGLCVTYYSADNDKKALFEPQKEILGVCPRCGGQVYKGKKNFYCGNRGCGFVLWKNDRFWISRKKDLTKKMVADFLTKGKTKVKGLYSEKKDKTYDAVIVMEDTGGKYINFKTEFNKEKGAR